MKIFISIVCFVLVCAILFFAFNYKKLETHYLDNNIGSYSVITQNLYEGFVDNTVPKYEFNIFYSFNNLPTNPVAFDNVRMFIDENNAVGNFVNLATFFSGLDGGYVKIDSDYNNFTIIDIPNFEFRQFGANITNFRAFYEAYKSDNGAYAFYKNYKCSARLYRVFMGEKPKADSYVELDNLYVDIRVVPHLDLITGQITDNFDITICPVSYSFEYNLAQTIKTLSKDIETLENAKPKLDDFSIYNSDTIEELNFFEKVVFYFERLMFLISHPIRIVQYWGVYANVVLGDLTGAVVVGGLPVYNPVIL